MVARESSELLFLMNTIMCYTSNAKFEVWFDCSLHTSHKIDYYFMNKHTHTTIVLSEPASMLNAHVKRGNNPWILAHAKQCEQNLVILFFLYLFFLGKLLLSNFRSRGHFHNTII